MSTTKLSREQAELLFSTSRTWPDTKKPVPPNCCIVQTKEERQIYRVQAPEDQFKAWLHEQLPGHPRIFGSFPRLHVEGA